MPDEVLPERTQQWVTALLGWIPDTALLPAEAIEAAQELQPHTDAVKEAVRQWLISSRATSPWQDPWLIKNFNADRSPLPVPTREELSETETALREHVLPETSEQELQEAVDEIPADPEKLRLAAFLADLLKRAASTTPTPWAVFVVAFWLALKMNPDVVGALALAFAVMPIVKPPD